jgi:SPP1 family predicted phage head-tail adaptor
MRAGNLRHRITIQQASEAQDTHGQAITTWATYLTAWAEISPLRGRELFAAQETHSEINTRIRLRYRPGVTAKMRVVYGSLVYNILAPLNIGSRDRELQLMCSEGVNDG